MFYLLTFNHKQCGKASPALIRSGACHPRGAISMSTFIFNELNFDDHEQVVFACEPKSGLKAIIAIHNTNLGPAMGGCRMWNYASEALAINDVLRLSRGMTYKNAVAGLPLGGGK